MKLGQLGNLGRLGASGNTMSLAQQAIAILRKYGSAAHAWIPGVGTVSGLTCGNSNDNSPAVVDGGVGLVLDACGSVGSELVTNGDFSNGSTGWILVPGTQTATISGGVCRLASADGSITSVYQSSLTAVAGKTYQVQLEILSTSGTGIAIDFGGATSPTLNTTGRKSFVLTCISTVALVIKRAGVCDTTIDNISVREVTGIHPAQTTSTARPMLRRGAVNLLSYSNAFSNWSKINVSVNGTLVTNSVGIEFARVSKTCSVTASTTYTCCVRCSPGSVSKIVIDTYDNSDRIAIFDLGSCSVISQSDGVSAAISQTSTGDYLCILVYTPVVSNYVVTVGPYAFGDRKSNLWDSVNVYAAALFQGTYTAAQIQALGGIPATTTQPASTALGNYYHEYKTDDKLTLSSLPFVKGDDFTLIVATKIVDKGATNQPIFTQSATSGSSRFPTIYYTGGVLQSYFRDDAGVYAILAKNINSIVSKPVVISTWCSSNDIKLRINGDTPITDSIAALGTTTLTVATIGNNAAIGTYYDGDIYPMVIIKGNITDAERVILEKFVAKLSGVTL